MTVHPPPSFKSASQTVLSRVQLTLHATRRTPHGVSRLVQAMSVWSVKTLRAPSRHFRDARVYGHATTVMHDVDFTLLQPPSAPLLSPLLLFVPHDLLSNRMSHATRSRTFGLFRRQSLTTEKRNQNPTAAPQAVSGSARLVYWWGREKNNNNNNNNKNENKK